jgi:hypothetical protein
MLRPVVQRFYQFVPLFVVAGLVTGGYQAMTWLGTQLSVYLITSVGKFVSLKPVFSAEPIRGITWAESWSVIQATGESTCRKCKPSTSETLSGHKDSQMETTR